MRPERAVRFLIRPPCGRALSVVHAGPSATKTMSPQDDKDLQSKTLRLGNSTPDGRRRGSDEKSRKEHQQGTGSGGKTPLLAPGSCAVVAEGEVRQVRRDR